MRAIAENEWPRDDELAPLVADVDSVPARERVRDLEVRLGIRVAQRAERLLAEDDPEAEGRVGRVPLEDADVAPPVELAQENREVEPSRAAADDRDVHASASCSRSSSSMSGDRREEDELVAAGLLVAADVVLQGPRARQVAGRDLLGERPRERVVVPEVRVSAAPASPNAK